MVFVVCLAGGLSQVSVPVDSSLGALPVIVLSTPNVINPYRIRFVLKTVVKTLKV
jgi:hypothetical protein